MVSVHRGFAAALAIVALGLSNCATQRAGASGDGRAGLLVELASNPHDSAVHLRLARFELAAHHRAAALRHFAYVESVGGLLGSKWTAADRRAYATLLRDRGLLRLNRGQASAAADLTHATSLGVAVSTRQRDAVTIVQALQASRHAAEDVRNQGLRLLCHAAATVGACATASALDRVAFATWLWQRRAKRASYDVLFEVSQRSGGVPTLAQTLWLEAQAWWTGEVLPLPPIAQATRCDAQAAAGLLVAGRPQAAAELGERAQAALDQWRVRNAMPMLPPLDTEQPCAEPVVPVVDASADSSRLIVDASDVVEIFAERWQLPAAVVQELDQVRSIAPGTLDRAVEQALDQSLDEAWTAAAFGEYFLLVGDPARARAFWQRAFDATKEPRYLQGLAVAAASAGDSDAATIWATQAAAASGDPALPLAEVAGAMAVQGDYPVALTLLRQALAIAGVTDANNIEREIAYCLQKLDRPSPGGALPASWREIQTALGSSRAVLLDLDHPSARIMLANLFEQSAHARPSAQALD